MLRYVLLRDMVIGLDANFSEAALVQRNNSDLANDLGNLARRVAGLCARYFDGRVPEPGELGDAEHALVAAAFALRDRLPGDVRALALHTAIEETMQFVRQLNKYITDTAPFKTVKTDKAEAARSLYMALEGLRQVAALLAPVMPQKMAELARSLGTELPVTLEALRWGGLQPGTPLTMEAALFPRRDLPEAPQEAPPAAPPAAKKKAPAATDAEGGGPISFDDFLKVELKVARVDEAVRVDGSDRLLKLQVDLGGERRQVVAGIAAHYAPEDVVGTLVVMVTNLAPRKVFKVLSQGMVLAVDTPDGGLTLVHPGADAAPGTRVR